jgi:hypothetical protein
VMSVANPTCVSLSLLLSLRGYLILPG